MKNDHLKWTLRLIIVFIFKFKLASSVICNYYPYSGSASVNITCSDACCAGIINTSENACCSGMVWNTGIYIALSVPILCCMASLVAGLSYCYLIIKPSTTVESARRHLANLRTRAITPMSSSNSLKDLPPSYAEIFQITKTNNNEGSSSIINNSRSNNGTNPIILNKKNSSHRMFSPPPPAYQSNIDIV